MMWDLDDDEWKAIKAMKDDPAFGSLADELYNGIDGPGSYVQTVEITNGNVTSSSAAQKVPTMGGILGIVLLIVGILLMVLGIIKGKKAKAAAGAPPPAAAPPQAPPQQGYPPQQPGY